MLKNKLGAVNNDQLDRLSAPYVLARYVEIDAGAGPQGHFDAEHLKAFHRHLFQDVFEWAGHTRNERVKLGDGSVATEPFLHKPQGKGFVASPQIAPALDKVGRAIEDADYLHGLSCAEFSGRAADLMAELNGIHPFREGNGRTQRVFIEQLARQAGHDLDFTVVSKERMIRASIAAHEQGDKTMMRRMFKDISDPARIVPLKEVIDFFDRQRFPWNEHYLATAEPGRSIDVVMGGIGGDHFFARTDTEILIGKTSDLPQPRPALHEVFTLVTAEEAEPEAAQTRGESGMGGSILTDMIDIVEATEQSVIEIAAGGAEGQPAPAAAPQANAGPDMETSEQLQHRVGEERKAALIEKANRFGTQITYERINERDVDQERER